MNINLKALWDTTDFTKKSAALVSYLTLAFCLRVADSMKWTLSNMDQLQHISPCYY